MLLWRRSGPQHQAEAARIAQPQTHRIVEFEIDMIVGQGRRAGFQDAQTAGHAEMHQQSAGSEIKQQILRAPPHRTQRLALQNRWQTFRHRLAQPRVADDHAAHRAAADVRRDPAQRGLDFG